MWQPPLVEFTRSSLARVMLEAGCSFSLESHMLLFLQVVLTLIEILAATMNLLL